MLAGVRHTCQVLPVTHFVSSYLYNIEYLPGLFVICYTNIFIIARINKPTGLVTAPSAYVPVEVDRNLIRLYILLSD